MYSDGQLLSVFDAVVVYTTNVPLISRGGECYRIISTGKSLIRWWYSAVLEGIPVHCEDIVVSLSVLEDCMHVQKSLGMLF